MTISATAPRPCSPPVATGKVMAAHKNRRRRDEFLDFMNDVVAAYPDTDTAIHVILDNLNTHKPKTDRWLKQHPNVQFHFTPTRASWLNQVEIWFSILQGQSLHGASFTSVKQLRDHIDAFIAAYNENAKPFAWTQIQGPPETPQSTFRGSLIPGTSPIPEIVRISSMKPEEFNRYKREVVTPAFEGRCLRDIA